MLNSSKSIIKPVMAKGELSKEILSVITSLIISGGAVIATVFMMFMIFIAAILLIGIVFS